MTNKQLKDKIENVTKELQKKLRLEDYELYLEFLNKRETKEDATADVNVDPAYNYITIRFYMDFIKDVYKDQGISGIRKTVIHEFIHVILWKLRTLAQDRYTTFQDFEFEDENATVKLERLFNEFIYGDKKKTYRVR